MGDGVGRVCHSPLTMHLSMLFLFLFFPIKDDKCLHYMHKENKSINILKKLALVHLQKKKFQTKIQLNTCMQAKIQIKIRI